MVEITSPSGHKFYVFRGKWNAVDGNDPVDPIIAESFDVYCSMQHECDSGAVPHRDYCFALKVVERFGGTITYQPPVSPGIPGLIY